MSEIDLSDPQPANPLKTDSPQPPPEKKRDYKTLALQIGVLILMIAISIAVYFLRDQVRLLEGMGYPGIFLLNLVSSGSIAVPVPALPVVFGMAAVRVQGEPLFNPFWVGVAAAIGATLGELSGYLAGLSGKAVMEKVGVYQRLHEWTVKYGLVTIAVFAFIPNPFFDFAGIAAGTLRMGMAKFLAATFIGKLGKMLIVAYGGAYSIGWIARFMH
jgi:membrane protein DedA with SNARE-associated domain